MCSSPIVQQLEGGLRQRHYALDFWISFVKMSSFHLERVAVNWDKHGILWLKAWRLYVATRILILPSLILLSSWRSRDLYSMSMSRQRGNSRHLFAPSSVLLFVMDDLDSWKTWGTLSLPKSITAAAAFPDLESGKISSKIHGVPGGNPGESNFYRGNLTSHV